MTMMDKKELQFKELSSIVGGNAVGPVNETGPLNTCDPPKNTGPLGTGPISTGPLGPGPLGYVDYPY